MFSLLVGIFHVQQTHCSNGAQRHARVFENNQKGKSGKRKIEGKENGAGNEIRTRDVNLGKVALYH